MGAKIVPIQKTVYQCAVCKREYAQRRDAELKCGTYEIEQPVFNVGDRVRAWQAGIEKLRTIVEVVGPVVGNRARDHVRIPFTGAHVYMYKLKRESEDPEYMEDLLFWTSELKPVK